MLGIRDKDIQIKTEILSGLTVAIALVPEAIAFSFIVGVDPIYGIYSAFMIGLITSLFGGRAGMISGATGAVAVIYAPLVATQGIEYMFLAVILAGIIQMIFGFFNLGRLIRLIPHAVMLGFVNGLALVIFRSQLDFFKVEGTWISGSPLIIMSTLVILTMVIILYLPKVTKIVPSSLVAIIFVTIVSIFLQSQGYQILTIKDFAGGSIQAGFPTLHIPEVPFAVESILIALPFALTAAFVGLIESLLTLNLIDEITDTRGDTQKESIAQGLANVCTGLISGIGGCAMIGQSTININAGARKYLSGFVAAIGLLLIVLIGYPLIDLIPLGAIVGVMFVVVYKTFAWDSILSFKDMTNFDYFIIFLVTIVTVTNNLAIAVISGVVLSSLHFAWRKSQKIIIKKTATGYKISGILFFGSVLNTKESLEYTFDKEEIILDFTEAVISDYSAVTAIETIYQKYKQNGVKLKVIGLDDSSQKMLKRAKVYQEII